MLNPRNIIGLDITGQTFRAVAVHARHKNPKLEGYAEVTTPDKVIHDGVIIDQDRGAHILQQLISALPRHVRSSHVHLALPERKTFIKLVEFPPVNQTELNAVVTKSIVQHIPFPIEEVYLDWKQLAPVQAGDRVRVLVGAVEKKIADDLVTVLAKAGLTPLSFAIESIATATSLINDQSEQAATMIVDIGSDQATAIVYDRGAIQFSTALTFSDLLMIETVKKNGRLQWRDAVKAKMICGLDPHKGKGKVRKILLPLLDQLASSLREVDQYYQNGFTLSRPIERYFFVGSGSSLIGITEYMTEQLAKPVSLGNPLQFFAQTKLTNSMTPERVLEFATALGLTLSAIHDA